MGAPPVVHCCVCGARHSSASPDVLYRSADAKWWCADETLCAALLALTLEAMRAAITQVWAELEANGWKIP